MDTASKALIEVREPRLFKTGAVIWAYMYGLLIGAPVLISMAWVSFQPLGAGTYLLPLAAVALTAFCLPIGFGNPHVRRLARRLPGGETASGHVVQLTIEPRLRTGMRAMLEDADDIGWLDISSTHLRFTGDSVTLELPLENIKTFSLKNVGFRGLFVYSGRLRIAVQGLKDVREISLADRYSLFLPQSHRRIRAMSRDLKSRIESRAANAKTIE